MIQGTEVSILDVGSGPLSSTGSIYPNVTINLTCCDALAKDYEEIFPERLIPIEHQDMEALTYPDKSFDIVHCVNALDHVVNPRAAIREMVRVSRKWVYLRHTLNEGEAEDYSGYHCWNIEPKGDDCRFWNLKDEFLLSEFGEWKTEYREESTGTVYKFGPQVISIYEIH